MEAVSCTWLAAAAGLGATCLGVVGLPGAEKELVAAALSAIGEGGAVLDWAGVDFIPVESSGELTSTVALM